MPQPLRQQPGDIVEQFGGKIRKTNDLVAVQPQQAAMGDGLHRSGPAAAFDQRHFAKTFTRAKLLDHFLHAQRTLVDAGLARQDDEQVLVLFPFADRVVTSVAFHQFRLSQHPGKFIFTESLEQVEA